jgi:hypothetical protein
LIGIKIGTTDLTLFPAANPRWPHEPERKEAIARQTSAPGSKVGSRNSLVSLAI